MVDVGDGESVGAGRLVTNPDPRPFGAIALGLALTSAVLSLTGFLSPFAYLGAVLAIGFGLGARGIPEIRWMGTVALGISVGAAGAATAMLVWMY